jgi:hypothetical protein
MVVFTHQPACRSPGTYLENNGERLRYADFIDKELVLFSLGMARTVLSANTVQLALSHMESPAAMAYRGTCWCCKKNTSFVDNAKARASFSSPALEQRCSIP